jgi:16S rRNA (cytosine967-C5)-methyltransferase
MTPGARLQAAIEILGDIVARGRAGSIALADWGRSHRFAGSGDRAWIGNLVFDALRRKQSLAYLMGSDGARSVALAALRHSWAMELAEIAGLCSGERYCPEHLTESEEKGLANPDLSSAPAWVQGDYPEWLQEQFAEAFGDDAITEGRALSERAPADLRVNALKATREKVLKALERHGAEATPYSPLGVRIPAREAGARSPKLEAEAGHGRGWFEIQDEGSQIAALLAGAGPRLQVADICAGAGGKTLAMAGQMQNTGQIYAYDVDPIRFRPIFERLKRAGARNVQTLPPGDAATIAGFEGRMDIVLIDAPCSGAGVWRRRPDAKWRLNALQLLDRQAQQRDLLKSGAALVKPGGTLAYVTCSVLPQENDHQIAAFLEAHPDFTEMDVAERAAKALSRLVKSRLKAGRPGLLLTPASHGTDGFYIALLSRRSS